MNNRQCVDDIAIDGNRFRREIVRHKDDADTKVLCNGYGRIVCQNTCRSYAHTFIHHPSELQRWLDFFFQRRVAENA